MPIDIIVSYDGTTNDDDALMLGRMLSATGATLSLAYVRHSREYDPRREAISEHDAQRRLDLGAVSLGDDALTRHVVVDPSTSAGLAALASSAGADLIVFGSDYRTPPGRVEPGSSAQGLLDDGAVAIGVAAAGLRVDDSATIATVSVAGEPDGAAAQTARSIASALGAALIDGERDADLILVDSRPTAAEGRVALDGSTRARLDSARGSVIVLPRGVPLAF